MTWFTLSIASVFALAVADLAQRHLLQQKNPFSERASTVFTVLFQAFLVLPLIYIFDRQGQIFSVFDRTVILRLLAVTLVSAVAIVMYLKSLNTRNISYSLVFVSGSAVVSTVLGIIFLNEGIYWTKFIGVSLVFSAIILLYFKGGRLEKSHIYGLSAGVLFGVNYTLDKGIVTEIDPLVYIFWAFSLIALFGFLSGATDVIGSLRAKTAKDFTPVILSGSGYLLYNYFTFIAYRLGGEVGKIDAINNTQVFLVVLFEIFILKQTNSIVLKFVSAALAFAGVYLLGLQ